MMKMNIYNYQKTLKLHYIIYHIAKHEINKIINQNINVYILNTLNTLVIHQITTPLNILVLII